MSGVSFLCFILLVPAMAALGHDIYLAFNKEEIDDLNNLFQFSDLGWLWVKYAPDTFDWVRAYFERDVWTKYVDPVLRQKAVLIALVPAFVTYIFLGFQKFFGLWPFTGSGVVNLARRKKSSYAAGGETLKSKAMKYKRK